MTKSQKKMFIGEVLSDKMDKTVVVKCRRTYRHPLLHKTIFINKKYKVHDELEQASIGDQIEFYEGRPMSKTKYMHLNRIVKTQA